MRKRLLSMFLAATMLGGILTACGSKEASDSTKEGSKSGTSSTPKSNTDEAKKKPFEGVTLKLWGAAQEIGEDNKGTTALLEKATEELGMTFEIEINPTGTEGDNILKTRCASGDLPDIVDYNSGSLFKALNPKEYFLDLTDEPMMEKVDDTFKSVVSQDGRVYGTPFTTTQAGAVVYYKPDYEELNLSVPKTWDEFLANCDALEKAGKTSVYLSGGDTWTTQVLFLGDNYNVVSANPKFAEEFTAGKAKFADTKEAVAGWEKYEDLVGRYNADATAAKYEDGQTAIATGQATHWFILTQSVASMIEANPDAKDKIGVFAIPGDKADDTGLTVWEPNGWYIAKNSPNAEAAKAFLEFWMREDNMDTYIELHGADGPSCIKGYTLPESVAPAISVDMQAYFDAGKTAPALEFLTPVKGATCEQITTSAAMGQIKGAEAAKMYDEDCKKSAVQQGLDWQ